MLKNKILILFLSICLSWPLTVFAEIEIDKEEIISQENIENIDENYQQNYEENNLPDNLVDNSNLLKNKENDFKQPTSKKMIAKRFGFAMLGVIISSVLIFLMLTIYNKLREKLISKENQYIDGDSLETPNSLKNAINIFLNKTK